MEDELQQALLQEFTAECGDLLLKIESSLLELEASPPTPELIQGVFRLMHTLKGNCLMLGFSHLETLTHTAENLLEKLRCYQIECSAHVLSLLLKVVDEAREAMAWIGRHGVEPQRDTRELQAQLARACKFGAAPDLVLDAGEHPAPTLTEEVSSEGAGDGSARGEAQKKGTNSHDDPHTEALDDNFIRLPVKKLDQFLDVIASMNAELCFWRTRVSNDITTVGLADVAAGLEDIGQQMTQLQDTILYYRMEPIGRIWRPYQRLVRDLAVTMHKRVLLVSTGEDTEVDRAVLATIKDPLGHLLRNAIVHGIEAPEERQRAGKPMLGRLELAARQEYGQITLTVQDDGAGLDADKILAVAIARNIVSAARAEKLTRGDIYQLLFTPGFSTSLSVDHISGRGTGLDVVKSALIAVGGSVQVRSELGQGCCFEMHIPQSMTMIPTLLVESQRSVLALPQAQVVEVIGLAVTESRRCLTTQLGVPAFVFRETCVPLYLLQDIIRARTHQCCAPSSAHNSHELNIVVLQHGARRLALQVDAVRESVDLVIKPLHRYLRDIPVVSGGAVLADGKVAFLLDIGGMVDWLDGQLIPPQ